MKPIKRTAGAARPLFPALTVVCLLTLAASLSGCNTSPPIQYHTLVSPPDSTTAGKAMRSIVVEHVTVPPQVDRSELVIREGQSRLMILGADWWGAPLPEEIRSALASQLDQGSTSADPVRVWVDVTRFDAIPSDQAWLDAAIRMVDRRGPADAITLTCHVHLHSPTDADVTSVVLAHQTNVQSLASRIRDLADRIDSEQATCPP